MAVIVASSELEELFHLSDQIVVLRHGRIGRVLTKDQFSKEQVLLHGKRSEGSPVTRSQAGTSHGDRHDAPDTQETGPAVRRNWLGRLVDIPEFGVVAACVLVFVIVTILQPRFADEANLQVIGLDLSNYGILAIGVGIVILTSGIDLSPGSMVALCSMVSAYLNVN